MEVKGVETHFRRRQNTGTKITDSEYTIKTPCL